MRHIWKNTLLPISSDIGTNIEQATYKKGFKKSQSIVQSQFKSRVVTREGQRMKFTTV